MLDVVMRAIPLVIQGWGGGQRRISPVVGVGRGAPHASLATVWHPIVWSAAQTDCPAPIRSSVKEDIAKTVIRGSRARISQWTLQLGSPRRAKPRRRSGRCDDCPLADASRPRRPHPQHMTDYRHEVEFGCFLVPEAGNPYGVLEAAPLAARSRAELAAASEAGLSQ
jgi:hypothetical protein